MPKQTPEQQSPELQFHPAAQRYPLLVGPEFAALVEDIRVNGLQQYITLLEHEGEWKILDGRNRYNAMVALGWTAEDIDEWCVKMTEEDLRDPDAFVVSLNEIRRHLSTAQLAAAAVKMIAAGTVPAGPGKASQRAADEVGGVSARSVENAKRVADHGAPELQQAVDAGEVPLSRAAAQVPSPPTAVQPVESKPGPAPPNQEKSTEPNHIDDILCDVTGLVEAAIEKYGLVPIAAWGAVAGLGRRNSGA